MHALYDALDAAVAARAPQLAAGQATGLPTAMAVQDTLANLVTVSLHLAKPASRYSGQAPPPPPPTSAHKSVAMA